MDDCFCFVIFLIEMFQGVYLIGLLTILYLLKDQFTNFLFAHQLYKTLKPKVNEK